MCVLVCAFFCVSVCTLFVLSVRTGSQRSGLANSFGSLYCVCLHPAWLYVCTLSVMGLTDPDSRSFRGLCRVCPLVCIPCVCLTVCLYSCLCCTLYVCLFFVHLSVLGLTIWTPGDIRGLYFVYFSVLCVSVCILYACLCSLSVCTLSVLSICPWSRGSGLREAPGTVSVCLSVLCASVCILHACSSVLGLKGPDSRGHVCLLFLCSGLLSALSVFVCTLPSPIVLGLNDPDFWSFRGLSACLYSLYLSACLSVFLSQYRQHRQTDMLVCILRPSSLGLSDPDSRSLYLVCPLVCTLPVCLHSARVCVHCSVSVGPGSQGCSDSSSFRGLYRACLVVGTLLHVCLNSKGTFCVGFVIVLIV